ncbi:MAG: hypothetical protein F6K11_14600 [Leptolyngbya sp. SIO3F4]|nr:hypothetical protein [Leptolyngbya sp. SIO3F4]
MSFVLSLEEGVELAISDGDSRNCNLILTSGLPPESKLLGTGNSLSLSLDGQKAFWQ